MNDKLRGHAGFKGKSAYDIAVEMGFEGTIEEWVNQNDTKTEVHLARGNFKNLKERLDNSDKVKADIDILIDNDENLQSQINGLASGSPLAASSTAEMTDTTKVYVNTTDGYWYYYDGEEWAQGGIYQATELPDQIITANKFKKIKRQSYNLLDKQRILGGYIGADGTYHKNATSTSGLNCVTDYFIELDSNADNHLIANHKVNYIYYDSSKQYISGTSVINSGANEIPAGAKYAKCSFIDTNINDIMVCQASSLPPFQPYMYAIDGVVNDKEFLWNDDKLPDSIINSYIEAENKFNPNNVYKNQTINSSGELIPSDTYFLSPYYEIEPSTDYYVGSSSGAVYVIWYDSNKQFISRVSGSNAAKTSPATAKYVRISGVITNLEKYYLIQTSSNEYHRYEFGIEGFKNITKTPSALKLPFNSRNYDYDYLFSGRTRNEYITTTKDNYLNRIINLNPNLDNSNSTILEYYLTAKSKVVEIDFDCMTQNAQNNESLIKINYYAYSLSEINPVSSSNRNMYLNNSDWRHKKYRFLVPEYCPYIRIAFVSNSGSKMSIKNININFVEKATGLNNKILKFVGHQGMNKLAPQNTIPSFDYAIAAGMDSCVINVNYTSDGYIVCLHDNTIDATSDGTGNIHDMTYAQALQYDFGGYFNSFYTGTKIPLLRDVLDLFAKHGIKPVIRWNDAFTGTNKTNLMNLLKKYDIKNNCRIIGFSMQILTNLKEEYPEFRYGYCYNNSSITIDETLINNIKNLGDDVLFDCEYQYLTNDIVALMHNNDIRVSTYFINSLSALNGAYEMGVDEIKTDFYPFQNTDF